MLMASRCAFHQDLQEMKRWKDNEGRKYLESVPVFRPIWACAKTRPIETEWIWDQIKDTWRALISPTSVFNILKKNQDPDYWFCIESLSHKTNDKQVKEVLKQTQEGLNDC